MIETQAIEYFIALAEALHFGRAAERVHITQPALSQQLNKLEGQIGVKLVERNRHQVTLTPAGELFLVEARRTLEQLDQAVKVAQRAGRGEIGHLSIGFVGSVLYGFLPRIFRQFRDLYPQVDMQLRELSSREQVDGLSNHYLDVGLLYLPLLDNYIQAETLVKVPLWAALPADHALAGKDHLEADDLQGVPLVMPDREHEPTLYNCVSTFFENVGLKPKFSQQAAQIQTMLGLVASGFGVFVGPSFVRHIGQPGVVYLPLDGQNVCLELALAWPRRPLTPILENFLAVARAVVSEGVD